MQSELNNPALFIYFPDEMDLSQERNSAVENWSLQAERG
jgi:hypothetical protein